MVNGDWEEIFTLFFLTPAQAFAKRAGSISIRATNYQFYEKAIFL
ncbi:MAG: hypothetical protein ACKPB4_22020 [Sphaerospermopsis kisseleviana]